MNAQEKLGLVILVVFGFSNVEYFIENDAIGIVVSFVLMFAGIVVFMLGGNHEEKKEQK